MQQETVEEFMKRGGQITQLAITDRTETSLKKPLREHVKQAYRARKKAGKN